MRCGTRAAALACVLALYMTVRLFHSEQHAIVLLEVQNKKLLSDMAAVSAELVAAKQEASGDKLRDDAQMAQQHSLATQLLQAQTEIAKIQGETEGQSKPSAELINTMKLNQAKTGDAETIATVIASAAAQDSRGNSVHVQDTSTPAGGVVAGLVAEAGTPTVTVSHPGDPRFDHHLTSVIPPPLGAADQWAANRMQKYFTIHETSDLPGWDLKEATLSGPDITLCCDACTVEPGCRLAVLCGTSCWLKTRAADDTLKLKSKVGCTTMVRDADHLGGPATPERIQVTVLYSNR